MASGHANRANRPNTWLHRPAKRREESSCQPGVRRSYVRLDLPSVRRQGRPKDCSTSSSNPMMEGPCADSEEKHEPVSDIHTVAVDSLIALDPERPIREADIYAARLLLVA